MRFWKFIRNELKELQSEEQDLSPEQEEQEHPSPDNKEEQTKEPQSGSVDQTEEETQQDKAPEGEQSEDNTMEQISDDNKEQDNSQDQQSGCGGLDEDSIAQDSKEASSGQSGSQEQQTEEQSDTSNDMKEDSSFGIQEHDSKTNQTDTEQLVNDEQISEENSQNSEDMAESSQKGSSEQESDRIDTDASSEEQGDTSQDDEIDEEEYDNRSGDSQKQEEIANIFEEEQVGEDNEDMNPSEEQPEDIEESTMEEDSSIKAQIEELKELREEIVSQQEELEKGMLNGEKEVPEESHEEEYTLGDQANKFLEQLGELPDFKDRDRGPGYSIDTRGYTQVPDSVIRTLISKFLNQRFCRKESELNVRSNSLDETNGFYKWKVKDVIVHLETEQVTKVLTDKYGYQYANGKNEFVPLSFYFDLSGSMSEYTNLLAVIAIELLKKGVKVLIGFNERVNVQIDRINGNITVQELADILSTAGYSSWSTAESKTKLRESHKVDLRFVDRNIDNYLLEKRAEKCVVFSDFDSLYELCNLSQSVQVYYFCFENEFYRRDLGDFKGFIYKVRDIKDIESGLIKINSNRFESLCFTSKNKTLEKSRGSNL